MTTHVANALDVRCDNCHQAIRAGMRAYSVMPMMVERTYSGNTDAYGRLTHYLTLCITCMTDDDVEDLLKHSCPRGDHHRWSSDDGWLTCKDCGLHVDQHDPWLPTREW